jgi:hypothetical protein
MRRKESPSDGCCQGESFSQRRVTSDDGANDAGNCLGGSPDQPVGRGDDRQGIIKGPARAIAPSRVDNDSA